MAGKMVEFGQKAKAKSGGTGGGGGGGFAGVISGAVSSAANYIQNAGVAEMGPWAAPGEPWPIEWKGDKTYWYPLARNGGIVQAPAGVSLAKAFPIHDNREKHHREAEEKWYTSHNYDLCGVWLHDCPWGCLYCLLGYSPLGPLGACWQRHRLQLEDYENYECCAALWGLPFTAACLSWTKKCPCVCMLCEGAMCFPCMLQANRWVVQSHYGLHDTVLDKCVWDLGEATCGACGKACCSWPELGNAAICLYAPFYGCIFAQHELEMKSRGYPHLGARAGDAAMHYHAKGVGCGYSGHVIVKKTIPHKHDEPAAAGGDASAATVDPNATRTDP